MATNILNARHAAGAQDSDKSVSAAHDHEVEQDDVLLASTAMDVLRLRKLGVQQETKRRFGLITILAFTTTMMCTWESAIPFFTTAFVNGSGVSMMYGYMLAWVGALATCATMAEMASMYPVSGGQYHWVALMGPSGSAKFLSWLTGWISTLGWQAAASSGTYLGGTMIQSLIGLNNPDYSFAAWQCTLMMHAVIALCLTVNTVLVKALPGLEGTILILHIMGFFAIVIPIVHLAPISTNSFVWTDNTNYSGYASSGVSWLIGQSASAVLFVGYDGACHMAEEVRNAAVNVPRAMFFTIFINGSLGFASYIYILYCFGDPVKALNTDYPFPFIEIFQNALRSKAGTTAIVALLLAMYVFATFGFVASASRQAWAFSRDNGLPFSRFFKQVDSHYHIPINTIALTGTISALLALVNIGSSTAFNAIISLVVSSYLSSYEIAIILLILRKVRGQKLSLGPWNLGKWGLPINIFAAAYTLVTVVFTFLPVGLPVDKTNMNYSCVMYGGVVVLGIIYYVLRGHHHYIGPRTDMDVQE